MSTYHMSYRKCHAIDNMRMKVYHFLYAMYGDNLIVWDSKKEFIWKGEPLKIKITIRNGFDRAGETMTVNVRWHSQWDCNKGTIAGYTIYAWLCHPLLGEVLGSRQYADTEKEAKSIARGMRTRLKER